MITQIVSSITEAFNGLLTGIGGGIVDAFNAIFVITDETTGAVTGLTNFGQYSFVLMGLGLAMTLIVAITKKVG